MPLSDLGGERVDYAGDHLLESAVPAEPYALFRRWLDEAFAARDRGELAEPTAMVVATSAAGRPRARTVLLKELAPDGFTFFTNYDSAKGAELSADPAVALHFGWHAIQRQVRVEGTAEKVAPAESQAYFATRPRGSQLGAWASAQSSTVGSLARPAGRVRRRRGPLRRTGGAVPRALGRLSRAAGRDRVLAGTTEPDARPTRLPAAAMTPGRSVGWHRRRRSQASSLSVITTHRNRRTASSSTVRRRIADREEPRHDERPEVHEPRVVENGLDARPGHRP